jgi:23S rRNA G2445 N2-methylase RlmL
VEESSVKPPREPGAIREALARGGFTPGKRDIEGVIDCLGDDDRSVVREAERTLARLGSDVLAALFVRAHDPEARVRAGVYRTLGRIAPKGEREATRVASGLDDPDPRVRRAAADALGKLTGSEATRAVEEALLSAWDKDPRPEMVRAIVGSLGKLGSVRALPRLRAATEEGAATASVARRAALTVARDAVRGHESAIEGARAAPFRVDVVLRCRSGLERIVAEEAAAWLPAVSRPRPGSGVVVARLDGTLRDLFRVRTADSFALLLPPVALTRPPDEALAAALTSDVARRVFETWTTGLVRYRIHWADTGHRRAATWRAAHLLAAMRPEWINDPRNSPWEVIAREDGDALQVELRPKGLRDPRFDYRVKDVPAASHPPLAAALVRAAEPQPEDSVWDPFVGSGVELVERAIFAPFAQLLGTDLDPRALEAARANLEAADISRVRLERADATRYAAQDTTLILTNPPMGRRLSRDRSLGPLLDRFLTHASGLLPRGGRLVWVSPLGSRTAATAGALGLFVELDEEVDMGGFRARLQRIVQRCTTRKNVQT